MAAAIPIVEITDDRNPRCIGCPKGEVNAFCTFMTQWMSTEFVVKSEMIALANKIIIHGTQNGTKRIGIGYRPGTATIAAMETQGLLAGGRDYTFEKPGGMDPWKLAQAFAIKASDLKQIGSRHESPGNPLLGIFVQA